MRPGLELGRNYRVAILCGVSRRNLILVAPTIGVAVLILAFFTNPDQEAHLKAINGDVVFRKPDSASVVMDVLLPRLKYNNYLVFSTTSFGNKNLTYGCFGRIQTTTALRVFSNT